MLVVLGALPGTGKTTLGKALAVKRPATYVGVGEIEHALTHHAKLGPDIGAAGYAVAFAVAAANLRLGGLVIVDSVNPVPESRQGWRDMAHGEVARILEIEVICSDGVEHRRRVETRTADIAGFKLPSWSSVVGRDYVDPAKRELLESERFGLLEATKDSQHRTDDGGQILHTDDFSRNLDTVEARRSEFLANPRP